VFCQPFGGVSIFRDANRSPLTDRRAYIVTYPYLSVSKTPTDSRIKERCIGRNSQRVTLATEWIDLIVLASLLRGEAVCCCPHSGQAASRSDNGRAPKASKSGELSGVDLHTRCQSGNQRSGRVPRMLRMRPSTKIAVAHSSVRIREPEATLHVLTPEARLEQGIIPRVIRASSTLRPPSTSSWTASSASLA
jgi:hypothetical protein